jgi:hypothetical protein
MHHIVSISKGSPSPGIVGSGARGGLLGFAAKRRILDLAEPLRRTP